MTNSTLEGSFICFQAEGFGYHCLFLLIALALVGRAREIGNQKIGGRYVGFVSEGKATTEARRAETR